MRLLKNSRSECTTFQSLPEEIVSLIGSFSPLSAKITLAKVCNLSRKVMQEDSDYKKIFNQQVFALLQNGNNDLHSILTSQTVKMRRQIFCPIFECDFMFTEVKYLPLEIHMPEKRRERAERLRPRIEELRIALKQEIEHRTKIAVEIVYRKNQYFLRFQEKKYNEMDSLTEMFRSILTGFTSCLVSP